jgi:hypothetical protein
MNQGVSLTILISALNFSSSLKSGGQFVDFKLSSGGSRDFHSKRKKMGLDLGLGRLTCTKFHPIILTLNVPNLDVKNLPKSHFRTWLAWKYVLLEFPGFSGYPAKMVLISKIKNTVIACKRFSRKILLTILVTLK